MYKKRVDRRFFLRGALGSVMALPFLDAVHGKAAIAAGNDQIAPRYFVAVRAGNGVAQQAGNEPEKFWPMENGALTAAGMRQLDGAGDMRSTGVLADYADKLLVVQRTNYQYPGTGCGHSSAGNQCLTATPPTSAAMVNRSMARGESIDNFIQRTLCPDDPNAMTLAAGRESSYLDEVLSYNAPLPGQTSAQLRSAIRNPWSAYTDLFGMPGQDNNGELTNYLAVQRKSVNDLMRDQLATILSSTALSQDDRNRLDLHQTSIRDLEIRMLDCHLDDTRWMEIQNAGDNDLHRDMTNVDAMTEMMMDITALCFACDIKRAVTLQIGNGNDQNVYDSVSSFPFHWISHRIQGDGGLNSAPTIANAAQLHYEVDKIQLGYFRYLLDKLSEYTTNTGPLLDSCVAMWTNDLANGVGHSTNNLPVVIAGSADGYLRQGQHINAADTGNVNGGFVTNSQVLNTIANAVGCGEAIGAPVTDFGFDGGQGFEPARTGEISGMKA